MSILLYMTPAQSRDHGLQLTTFKPYLFNRQIFVHIIICAQITCPSVGRWYEACIAALSYQALTFNYKARPTTSSYPMPNNKQYQFSRATRFHQHRQHAHAPLRLSVFERDTSS